ncbi:MAG: NAD(P)-dependent alcohol dehydrogenase [Planctomycetota bacterium]
MREYRWSNFGLDAYECVEAEIRDPGPGEVRVRLQALSLNFRDLLIVRGLYNPHLDFPAVPLSDGAGEVVAVGDGVESVKVGDTVVSHFVAGWQDGPYRGEYLETTLGTPGPGLAREEVVLPETAVLPAPAHLDPAEAACLPIAALTAWSALVTAGGVQADQTVLTLGTGGVSVFALQIGHALGARVIVTSKSDEKLARCREMGAFGVVNYADEPDWERSVLAQTDGAGVDVVVENGGVGTLSQSLRAVKAGGTVAMLGALTGLQGEVDIAPILMKRVTVAGILVDSRASFVAMNEVLAKHEIRPVIHSRYPFSELPTALAALGEGHHFGKIVVDIDGSTT